MEKPAQTPNGAPHRRRRRRPAGSAPQAQPPREGKAPEQPREPRRPAPHGTGPANNAPGRENPPRQSSRPRRGQGQPAPQEQPPKAGAPAQQPPRRPGRPAPQTPSRPLADQPKAPRSARAPRPARAPEQPGLDLISRRPPKQKFASFEEYLAAHGGMTVPLPDEPGADKPATAAEAAE